MRASSPSIVLPIIFVIMGAISFIAGIAGIVGATRQAKRKPVSGGAVATNIPKNQIKDEKFFFHFAGKMGQSYLVEDKNRETVFECKLLKFNPFGSNLYEFIDKKSGASQQMKISKTITQSSSGGMMFVGDILSSRFKIDGVNCWDYVASMGYEIKHLLEEKTVISYKVLKGGKTVANIFPANVKDPFNENSKNFLRMGKGVYRLEISDANFFDIIMIAFIVSRTEMVE